MGEALTKAQWQEKKRNGSKKEQRAAISVQIGRVAEKLHDRAESLGNSQADFPRRSVDRDGLDIVSHDRRHSIRTGKKIYKSDFFETPQKGQSVTVQYVSPGGNSEHLEVDPTGEHRPSDSMSDRFRMGHTTWVLQPSPEDMVKHAAPALRHLKNEIDTSENVSKAA